MQTVSDRIALRLKELNMKPADLYVIGWIWQIATMEKW